VPRWAKALGIVLAVCGFMAFQILVFGMAMQYYWVRNGFIGGAWSLLNGLGVEHRFYRSAVARMAGGLAPAVLIYSTVKLLELWGKRKH